VRSVGESSKLRASCCVIVEPPESTSPPRALIYTARKMATTSTPGLE